MADSSELRAQFLRANPFRSVEVEVDFGNGPQKVVLRQPSVEERSRIHQATQNKSVGLAEAQALCVVLCARNPEGGGRLFEESDVATLMAMPAGSWVDLLSAHVMQLLAEGAEVAKKS